MTEDAAAREMQATVPVEPARRRPDVVLVAEPAPLFAVADDAPDYAGIPFVEQARWARREYRAAAARLYDRYLRAIDAGKPRRAARAWSRFDRIVRLDRALLVARASATLGLDAAILGRAHVTDRASFICLAGTVRRVVPLEVMPSSRVGRPARDIAARWTEAGAPFARYAVADPECRAPWLVAVISVDGEDGDYYRLGGLSVPVPVAAR